MALLIAGGSILALVTFGLHRPILGAIILATALVGVLGEGAYRLTQAASESLEDAQARLGALEQGGPELAFGRAEIPRVSQPIHVFVPELGGQAQRIGSGRIIRVPIVNAQGAGEAKRVHARLTFLPDDRDGQISPRHPAQGQWFSEHGPEIEIDLPGNGRPRMLDVVLVLDREYPHAYEWTIASQHAALRGYAIKANLVTVEIEVLGTRAGSVVPRLHDRLVIRLDNGMIRADWASAGADEATNWVQWDNHPLAS